MPTVGQVSNPVSTGLGIALPLLTSLSNPVSAAIAAGVGLVALVDKIGQGRKAANKFTQKGGPQDIINKQLAAISSSSANAQEKAQATDSAWRAFLQASNEFAAKNPKQSKVVEQAIYKTPELTTTVQSLLGKDPLASDYTVAAAPGIASGKTKPNPGPSVVGSLINAGVNVALPYALSKVPRVPVSQIGAAPPGTNPNNMLIGAPGKILTQGADGVASAVTNAATGAVTSAATAAAPSLLSKILPTLISTGTSLLGGVIASRAAGKAADVQSDAALEAARMNSEAGDKAIAFGDRALAQQQQNAQPWIDAGTASLKKIGDITSTPFTAPTPEEAMQDPGIQFQLQQGQQALEAYLRRSGNLLSGKAVKEIEKYAQGVASTGYNNVFNRKVATREANLNPEYAVAGLGHTSVGQLNSDVGAAGANAGNVTMSTARNVGDMQTSAAAARASGYVGSGNAVGGAVADVGNNILDTVTIRQLLERMGTAA